VDLSWYLLQFGSGDAMDEGEKPASASYILKRKEKLIYEVVRNGKIVSDPVGARRSVYRERTATGSEQRSDP
jgi:hypothetical protein